MDKAPPGTISSHTSDSASAHVVALRGTDIAALQSALVAAFTLPGLEQMAVVQLNRALATIVPTYHRTLNEIAWDLVWWAIDEETAGIQGLLQAALNQNPNNPELTAVHDAWEHCIFTALPECPYPGMMPFAEADHSRFFGREHEIAAAIQLLRLHPFLAVIGSSGSGKSSLVFAGIVPAMRKASYFGGEKLVVTTLRPGKMPIDALVRAIGCTDSTPDGIVSCVQARAGHQPELLVIDQFEEAFTIAEKAQSLLFQKLLARLVAMPNLFLLFTVRADFYPDLMNSPLWSEIRDHRLEVTALQGEGLREAIVRPVAEVGVTVEAALVELLLADAAGEPGALPFVQETLVLLWDGATRRKLTVTSYAALTGKNGGSGLSMAMARRADQVLKEFTPEGKRMARRTCLRLVQFGEGRPDTRRQQTEADLRAADDEPDLFDAVLRQMIDHRLLTADSAEASPMRKIDIAHEALLNGWPALHGWIDVRRKMEGRRRRLESKADEWNERGAGAAALLDEVELREAETWLASEDARDLGYSRLLVEHVAASRATIDETRRRAEEAQQQQLKQAQELAEEQRLRTEEHKLAAARQRKRAYLATAFAVAALCSAAAALWFGIESDTNRKHAENARTTAVAEQATAQAARQEAVEGYSRQLAVQALGLLDSRPDVAALLALEAGKTADTAEARGSLLAAVTANPAFQYMLYDDETAITQAQVASIGSLAASSGSTDGSIILWDLEEGTVSERLLGHEGRATALAWHPNGERLASGDSTGNVILWEIQPGAIISQTLYRPAHPYDDLYAVRTLQFSPDGALLAAGGCATPGTTGRRRCVEGGIRIWDLNSATDTSIVITDHVDSVLDLAFSADSSKLATAGCAQFDDERGTCRQGDISLLSVRDGWAKTRTLAAPGSTGTIASVAFHPSEVGILASGSEDGSLQIWDASDGSVLATRYDGNNPVTDVAFSPNRTLLANGILLASARCGRLVYSSISNVRCAQGKIQIWQLASGRLDAIGEFAGHTDWPTALSFSPSDRRLLSGGRDGNLIVWDAFGWPPLAAYAWSPDLSTGRQLAAKAVAYTNDNSMLAVGVCDYTGVMGTHCLRSTITLLNSADRQVLSEIQSADAGIAELTFDPASSPARLAAAGCEQIDAQENCVRSRIALWHFDKDRSFRGEILGQVDAAVTALAFARQKGRLAVGDDNGMVTVWDTQARRPLYAQLRADSAQVTSVSFSADGTLLAAAGYDGTITLWDAESGNQTALASLMLPGSSGLSRTAFSPAADSLLLTSGGGFAHPITLWDGERTTDGFVAVPNKLDNSPVEIVDFAFASNGSILASVDAALEFVLWDVVHRRPVGPALAEGTVLQNFMGRVHDVDMRPDGKQLAAVVDDRQGITAWVLVWDIDPASWIQRACWRANRPGLTAAERQQYLGKDGDTRPVCP